MLFKKYSYIVTVKNTIKVMQLRVLFFLACILVSLQAFGLQEDLVAIRQELQEKSGTDSSKRSLEIFNISYDPTREFYDEYNSLFTKWWKERTKQSLFVVQSHAGSGTQARSVIQGLQADVVSLALALDIDAIEKRTGLVGKNWEARLPNHSAPYYSTIVFLVRKGNPKQIKEWGDLVKEGVQLVLPNPKTSGGARWIYMAAWGFALAEFGNQEPLVRSYMKKLFQNAATLDIGARASTTTFIQRKIGDVLLTWENEAYLAMEKLGRGQFEIIYPSLSIKATPPVAWLEKIVQKKGTQDVAEFYLKYLYSPPAQNLIAKYYFRPFDLEVLKMNEGRFPSVQMVTIQDFGGWEKVQEEHFKDGGIFDEIYLSESK